MSALLRTRHWSTDSPCAPVSPSPSMNGVPRLHSAHLSSALELLHTSPCSASCFSLALLLPESPLKLSHYHTNTDHSLEKHFVPPFSSLETGTHKKQLRKWMSSIGLRYGTVGCEMNSSSHLRPSRQLWLFGLDSSEMKTRNKEAVSAPIAHFILWLLIEFFTGKQSAWRLNWTHTEPLSRVVMNAIIVSSFVLSWLVWTGTGNHLEVRVLRKTCLLLL